MTTQAQELQKLQTEVDALSARLNELHAVQTVRNVLIDYTLYHDRGMSQELAELFTEDAVLDIAGFGADLDTSLTGRNAIREMYQQIDARSSGPPPHKHAITNLRIDVRGEAAIASSYLLDWGGTPTAAGPGGSIYHDRLEKQSDGRWLIKHKRIICTAEITVDAVLSVNV